MTEKLRVLIIDDEESVRTLIEGRLTRRGHVTCPAASGERALALHAEFGPHVAITDLRMPGLDGFQVIEKLKIPTIIITGHGDKDSAIRAVEAGAFAFFEKPFDLDALEVMVTRAGEKRAFELEREALLKRLDQLCRLQGREIENLEQTSSGKFIGESAKVKEIKTLIGRMAKKPSAGLLILGESGTGKEVVARELHRLTHPKTQSSGPTPFLALNCSAIPADLLESELFGHEKGAFSGAQTTRIGLAEAVREGTLFLDEVGELDPRHQAKILRLLQERCFKRVGANSEMPFKGRIVTATHRDLPALAKTGGFREDLYYRLSVVSVTLPPLRERREDLEPLVTHLCARHGLRGVVKTSLDDLLNYDWPGNIRELNNWVERASILGLYSNDGFITAPVNAEKTGSSGSPPRLELITGGGDLKSRRNKILDEYDRRWIESSLQENDGNVSATAKALGIDRKNLTRRMKDLGFKKAA